MSLWKRVFTERRSVVLPLVVFLVADLAALGGVFYLQRDVDVVKEESETAVLSLGTAQVQRRDSKATHQSKDLAETQLKQFYGETLPKDFASAVNITAFWLSKTARAARVDYRTGTLAAEEVRDSRLSKVTGQITLVGEYADIRRFLYEVESAQEFVIIEKVELSQPNASQGNALLEVQLSIVTYYLTDGQTAPVKVQAGAGK